MKIFVIRHGQTTGDIEDRFGGAYDDHLSDEGKHQASILAKGLANKRIQTIYYSPLLRAKETAMILDETIHAKLEPTPYLAERNKYGILSGMTKSDALKTYPQLVELVKNDHNTIIDAEPFQDFQSRVMTAFNELLTINREPIAIVTHGGPIKVILKELFGKVINHIEDCGWVVIETIGQEVSLQEEQGVH